MPFHCAIIKKPPDFDVNARFITNMLNIFSLFKAFSEWSSFRFYCITSRTFLKAKSMSIHSGIIVLLWNSVEIGLWSECLNGWSTDTYKYETGACSSASAWKPPIQLEGNVFPVLFNLDLLFRCLHVCSTYASSGLSLQITTWRGLIGISNPQLASGRDIELLKILLVVGTLFSWLSLNLLFWLKGKI